MRKGLRGSSQGSSEGGIPKVHQNCRREYRRKGLRGSSHGSSEGGIPEVHQNRRMGDGKAWLQGF